MTGDAPLNEGGSRPPAGRARSRPPRQAWGRGPVETALEALPAAPGTYLLVLEAPGPVDLQVGRRGRLRTPAGLFAYVGSALGPGGLRARLGRHLAGSARRRWHIDHLRAATSPAAAWWVASEARLEHAWAAILLGLPGARVPLPRFGASDCRCPTHLVWFPPPPTPSGRSSRRRPSRER